MSSGSWIVGSKCGGRYADCERNIFWWRQCIDVGQHLPHLKNKACHHWRQSQCRDISKWDSATSGNPVSPQSGIELYPPRWQRSPLQSRVSQRLPPEFGVVEDAMADQQSWPKHHGTLGLGVLSVPQWPTQQLWLTCDKCWLKNGMPSWDTAGLLWLRMVL